MFISIFEFFLEAAILALGLFIGSRFFSFAGGWRSVVVGAAWWHEFVGGSSVWVAHWPSAFVWRFLSRNLAHRVDRFVQETTCLILFQWLAWLIAEDYLRAKWKETV